MECAHCHAQLAPDASALGLLPVGTAVHLVGRQSREAGAYGCVLAEHPTPSRRKHSPFKLHCAMCRASVGNACRLLPSDCPPVFCFAWGDVLLRGVPVPPKCKSWRDLGSALRSVVGPVSEGQLAHSTAPATTSSPTAPTASAPVQPPPAAPLDWPALVRTAPREYQREVAEAAAAQARRGESALAWLPTGAGKTLVACALVEALLRANPTRAALLVVDRVPLVYQQAAYMRRETDRCVRKLSSESTSGQREEVGRWEAGSVAVATAQSAENALGSDEAALAGRLCAVVFDEGHHASGDHPYARLLRRIALCPADRRPRVLALSASPGSGDSVDSARASIERLCETFGARLAAPHATFDSLVACSAQETTVVPVDETEGEQQAVQALDEVFRDVQGSVAVPLGLGDLVPLRPDSPNVCGHLLSVAQNGTPGSSKADVARVLAALSLARDVCTTVSVAAAARCLDSESLLLKEEFRWAVVEAADRLRDLAARPGTQRLSAMAEALVRRITEAEQRWGVDEFRGIVFARTRRATALVADLLRERFAELSPKRVLGHGGYEGMSWDDEQRPLLELFRAGHVKLLVSTSVLEEGLDVQACNLVVRLGGPLSVRSLVQTRGRARCVEGQLVVVMPRPLVPEALRVQRMEAATTEAVRLMAAESPYRDEVARMLGAERRAVAAAGCGGQGVSAQMSVVAPAPVGGPASRELVVRVEPVLQAEQWDALVKRLEGDAEVVGESRELAQLCLRAPAGTEPRALFDRMCGSGALVLPLAEASEGLPLWLQCSVASPAQQSQGKSLKFSESDAPVSVCRLLARNVAVASETLRAEVAFGEREVRLRFACAGAANGSVQAVVPLAWVNVAVLVAHSSGAPQVVVPLRHSPRLYIETTRSDPAFHQSSEARDGDTDSASNEGDCIADNWAGCEADLRNDGDGGEDQLYLYRACPEAVRQRTGEQFFAALCRGNALLLSLSDTAGAEGYFRANAVPVYHCEMCCERAVAAAAPWEPLRSLEMPLFACAPEVSESAHPSDDDDLGENVYSVRRLLVTPSRVVDAGRIAVQGNRVLRHYSARSFASVVFADEDGAQMLQYSAFLSPFVSAALRLGVRDPATGLLLRFVGCSASQLKRHATWYTMLEPQAVRDWVGDFSGIAFKGKALARLGLAFTASVPGPEVPESCMAPHGDITVAGSVDLGGGRSARVEYCFSDGAGKMSPAFAERVAAALGLAEAPCAVQMRVGGYKGVLALDPALAVPVVLRESMRKFASGARQLEVVSVQRSLPAHLNRQVVLLLSTLGVPDEAFLTLQREHLRGLVRVLVDDEAAAAAVAAQTDIPADALLAEGTSMHEPFLRGLREAVYSVAAGQLRRRARIPVRDGRVLMGVLDETGTLDYGQVYVRLTDGGAEGPATVRGRVAVCKNPCLHPGDVRVLEAVEAPALWHLHDCVVFPARGPRPHADECSGSDLDGDQFLVLWDQRLVPERHVEPMDYSAEGLQSTGARARAPRDAEEFVVEYMSFASLGALANAHLALASTSPHLAGDVRCVAMARCHAVEVDFPKTGVHVDVPAELRPREFPEFMERPGRHAMHAPCVLQALYDDCVAALGAVDDAQAAGGAAGGLPLDVDLLHAGRGAYADAVRALHAGYGAHLSAMMRDAGCTEAELVLRCGSAGRQRAGPVAVLRGHYRRQLLALAPADAQDGALAVASAAYEAAYTSGRHLSFAWLLPAQLSALKRGRSRAGTRDAEERAGQSLSAWLARAKGDTYEQLLHRQDLASRLADAVRSSRSHAAVRLYGSSAYGLFDECSDVDVCVELQLPGRAADDLLRELLPAVALAFPGAQLHAGWEVPVVRGQCEDLWFDLTVRAPGQGPDKSQRIEAAARSCPQMYALLRVAVWWARATGVCGHGRASLMPTSTLALLVLERLRGCVAVQSLCHAAASSAGDGHPWSWAALLDASCALRAGEETRLLGRAFVQLLHGLCLLPSQPLAVEGCGELSIADVRRLRDCAALTAVALVRSDFDVRAALRGLRTERTFRVQDAAVECLAECVGRIEALSGAHVALMVDEQPPDSGLRRTAEVTVSGCGPQVAHALRLVNEVRAQVSAARRSRGAVHVRGCTVVAFAGSLGAGDAVGLVAYAGCRSWKHAGTLYAPRLVCRLENTAQHLADQLRQAAMRQLCALGRRPADSRRVQFGVRLGRLYLVNDAAVECLAECVGRIEALSGARVALMVDEQLPDSGLRRTAEVTVSGCGPQVAHALRLVNEVRAQVSAARRSRGAVHVRGCTVVAFAGSLGAGDAVGLVAYAGCRSWKHAGTLYAPRLVCRLENTAQHLADQLRQAAMRQLCALGRRPADSRRVQFGVRLGRLYLVNVRELRQTTVGELQKSLLKGRRQSDPDAEAAGSGEGGPKVAKPAEQPQPQPQPQAKQKQDLHERAAGATGSAKPKAATKQPARHAFFPGLQDSMGATLLELLRRDGWTTQDGGLPNYLSVQLACPTGHYHAVMDERFWPTRVASLKTRWLAADVVSGDDCDMRVFLETYDLAATESAALLGRPPLLQRAGVELSPSRTLEGAVQMLRYHRDIRLLHKGNLEAELASVTSYSVLADGGARFLSQQCAAELELAVPSERVQRAISGCSLAELETLVNEVVAAGLSVVNTLSGLSPC
eukprot:m51a1_g5837 putative rna-dependent rna polymerase 1 (2648) ;mRNA; f:289798-298706